MHPGSTKMYKIMKVHYWWPSMPREIAKFVAKCLICQRAKLQHQKVGGLLCPLPSPRWKWEHITVDLLFGLPKNAKWWDSGVYNLQSRFVLYFKLWPKLQEALGNRLHFSTGFHPQTNSQFERTIQTLEDMLRAYLLQFKESWDECLSLIEFDYNSYHSIIIMVPFEALYGRCCRTQVCRKKLGERKQYGPKLV